MAALRRYVSLGFLLTLAAGCRPRAAALCPANMRYDSAHSVEGQVVWCRSADGHGVHWIQLQQGNLRRQVCEFRDGHPDGAFRLFHPGGARWIEGTYAQGVIDGHWLQWDKTGSLVAEGDYRRGKLVSGAPVAIAAHCESLNP